MTMTSSDSVLFDPCEPREENKGKGDCTMGLKVDVQY